MFFFFFILIEFDEKSLYLLKSIMLDIKFEIIIYDIVNYNCDFFFYILIYEI